VTKPAKPAPRHSKHLAQLGTLPPDLLNQLNRIIQRAMALKPKDRYQHVADFANDLKQVIKVLPQPTPPPGTSRPLDPNSTQPDLAELYDALQAAKDKNNQGGQGVQASSPPSPPTPKASPSSFACPRCGMPVLQQSTFCPRCGTPLGGSPQNKGSDTRNSGDGISADQTLLIRPQGSTPIKPTGTNIPSSTPGHAASSSPVSNAGLQVQQLAPSTAAPPSPAYSGQNNMFNGQTPQGTAGGNNTPSPSNSLNISPRVLISLLVVLALAIALVLLLLSHHG